MSKMPDDVIKSLEKAEPYKWPADNAEPQKEEATREAAAPQPLPIEEALRQAEIENRIGDDADGSTKSNGTTATGHAPADQGEAIGQAAPDDRAEALDSLVTETDRRETAGRRSSGLTFPQFLTPAEFCKDHKGLDYLIKRHVARDQLTMIFGQPSCGKTFYALDQALTVAAEGIDDWHGMRIKKGCVMYLTGEGRTGLKQRITAWIEQHDLEYSALSNFRCEYAPFKLNEFEQVSAFIQSVKGQKIAPDWIIFDTLAEFMGGDENKAEDAQAVVDGCHAIMSAFHCAVTLIHHQGVSQEAKDQKRSRGSSAYFGALDVQTIIEVTDDDDRDATKINAEQTKNKDDSKQFSAFILEKVELQEWRDEDGEPITSRVLRSSKEATDTGSRPVSDKDQRYINAYFRCAETGRGVITTATGQFRGVRHSVWREYYCDPRTNTELTNSNTKQNAKTFEVAINRLLRQNNIGITNTSELANGDADRDKRIYMLRGKNGKLVEGHAAEYAEATRKRQEREAAEDAQGGRQGDQQLALTGDGIAPNMAGKPSFARRKKSAGDDS